MTYDDLRSVVKTGDVFGAKGNGLFSKLIMKLTKESYSHVALLVWIENGLWVFEFVEGRGYQCMPASQWVELRKGQEIYYGQADSIVHENSDDLVEKVLSFRASRIKQYYGYFSLLRVLIAQSLGTNNKMVFNVCSTFVQECWQAAKFFLSKTADPGDIMKATVLRIKITTT